MDPDVYQSEKTYRFVGPSLFFKNDQTSFPFEKFKNKKVLYISLGTLHNKKAGFYKTCLRAFINSEFFVIISIGFDTNLNEFNNIPNNFLIRQSVTQQKLLEYVDLFITHAGINSVNEAICNGVPILLLPYQSEQEMITRKAMEMGIGIK